MSITHETLGAHIRNILTPYANIIQILEEINNPNVDNKTKQRLKNFLFTKVNPNNLNKNLEHFIKVSKLDEVEAINWRATKLFEEYCKEKEC